MRDLVRIRLRPKIFRSSDLRRTLSEGYNSWIFGEDMKINLKFAKDQTTFARIEYTTGRGRRERWGIEGKGSAKSICADIAILSGIKREERERNRLTLLVVTTRVGDIALPKTNDKVRKLVPLKMPYEELRPIKRKLNELHLDFLLWNWNCISASICKEIIDKNRNDGKDLRGNPMLWTIEH